MRRTARIAIAALVVSVGAPAETAHAAATEIFQQLSLREAAAAGILKLSAKGGLSGDQVAVDLEGAHVPDVPVVVTIKLEFYGTMANGMPWPPEKALEIEEAVEALIGSLDAPSGATVNIDVDAQIRTGGAATPGFHSILLKDIPSMTGPNFVSPGPPGADRTGEFIANEPASVWAHEVLHLAGLRDSQDGFRPSFVANGMTFPLPPYTGDPTDAAAVKNWFYNEMGREADALRRQYPQGRFQPGLVPGHEMDIMWDPYLPGVTVDPDDIEALAQSAGIRVLGNAGDLLLNKDPEHQNFGVGAPLDLRAARGETTHVDGLYVYCIDFEEHTPLPGQLFDVLGPAGEQPEPQLGDLQTLLETIAPHQENELFAVPGAQLAVWAVTDGLTLVDPPAAALLEESDLAPDAAFYGATPHPESPNALGPTTAAVSRTAVLPPIEVERGPSPVPPDAFEGPSQLVLARVVPTLAARGSPDPLELTVLITGSSDALQIAVEKKRGRKWKTAGAPASRGAHTGYTTLDIPVPAKKGKYRVRVTGQNEELVVEFKVKRRVRP